MTQAPVPTRAAATAAMLGARSVAVVGASPRPDSFGARMVTEVSRGPGTHRVHLVNPRYDEIAGRPCLASLAAIGEPVDLVMLGVGDTALPDQLRAAVAAGARSAVVYGSAHGADLRAELAAIAADAGMALCGAGCMGFVNVETGLRALGYLERADVPVGPIGLVTHSGSVFSALLRTRRALGWSVAVSSGQELVTTTADYLGYLLDDTATRVVALVLETVRSGERLVRQLRRAAERDVAVVLLPVGTSSRGAAMVAAHSGALAGGRATWEALAEGTGARLVSDLAELTDTLELFAAGRRPRRPGGLATVHDSGAERSLLVDLAGDLEVPLAPLDAATVHRLDAVLDPGLAAENPLDVWGTGARTRTLLADCLRAMADDPNVAVTALAVDLVEEYDGDTSYPDAVLDAVAATDDPVVVLTNVADAIDPAAAARLRAHGVPVLEGTRSGLVALRHLLTAQRVRTSFASAMDTARRSRWLARLDDPAPISAAEALALLDDYGIRVSPALPAEDEDGAAAAAREIGFPVVLKTDEPPIAHRSDVGGVHLGLTDEAAVRGAYRDLAERLGKRVVVAEEEAAGVELALGLVSDPALGPLVLVAAGGVLAELVSDRAVALPPLDPARARALVERLRVRTLLDGWRGGPAADLGAVADAVVRLGQLAVELGDRLAALDVNPVIVGPGGAVAVDALVERRT